ncbi:MAG TPA: YidB family protein [Ignavibacteriaceae bacterium]
MDILNAIKSVLGGGAGSKQNDLMSEIMNIVGGQSGGLNGLISQFTSKGLGDVVSSWVGTGNNLPVSPDQIKNVIGHDTLKELAAKTGMDQNSLTGKLSDLLPQVVDKLTPDGKVPEGDILSQGMNILNGILGKK